MVSGKMIRVVAPAGLIAVWAVGSLAGADIISDLEVHYPFENASNLGENWAGEYGVPCG